MRQEGAVEPSKGQVCEMASAGEVNVSAYFSQSGGEEPASSFSTLLLWEQGSWAGGALVSLLYPMLLAGLVLYGTGASGRDTEKLLA